ncbi:hypothetical protein ACJZ2D_006713 [Fusarium nematophilum]
MCECSCYLPKYCSSRPSLTQEQEKAVFITIGSSGGIRPRPGLVWYNSSKAAAMLATKNMAVEYVGRGIRFNSVCPVFGGNIRLSSHFMGMDDSEENRKKSTFFSGEDYAFERAIDGVVFVEATGILGNDINLHAKGAECSAVERVAVSSAEHIRPSFVDSRVNHVSRNVEKTVLTAVDNIAVMVDENEIGLLITLCTARRPAPYTLHPTAGTLERYPTIHAPLNGPRASFSIVDTMRYLESAVKIWINCDIFCCSAVGRLYFLLGAIQGGAAFNSMAVLGILAPLDASKLQITDLTHPKPLPDTDSPELATLKASTDRMITASWNAHAGWTSPKVVPYGPVSLMPSASALQYATQCFEGMKVFRGYDGRLRLFRPLYNCERMLKSATRISLPPFDPKELLKLIHKLCELEAPKWLPKDKPGSALYLRPTMIGSDSSLGFKVPDAAELYIFMVYWPAPRPITLNGNSPKTGTRLLASSESAVRAWPGGTGAAKVGGNYGSALVEHALAKEKGYDQVLWLYGPDRQITEAGSTNIFIMWKTASGDLQAVTSPLDEDNLILAGNTRRSIIELTREMFAPGKVDTELQCEVLERKITMGEVEEAARQGRLVGVFVVGTAFWIQEVSEISYNGEAINIGVGTTPHVSLLQERMTDIMYGKIESDWVDIVENA